MKSVLYAIETQSEHPLAEAVVRVLEKDDIKKITVDQVLSITGKGVQANYLEHIYHVGSPAMMQEEQVVIDDFLTTKLVHLQQQAKTVILFAEDRVAKAVIAITDKIKSLSAMGIDVYMLTGDNQQTAKAIASEVGISHFKAEVLPADKGAFIKSLQEQGKTVAMVGDGINDSHALALADVSIAMGKGSDIAMDVAKMTLISSDLNSIPRAIKLSKATVATIKQNLFWAFIYNLIGIPIAAGVLYPVNGFLLNPMIAGAAMVLSSVSVVSNSLRLKYSKI